MAKITFEVWKGHVNRHILRVMGLSSDDLPDYPYRKEYDEGKDANATAARAIRAAKKDMGY